MANNNNNGNGENSVKAKPIRVRDRKMYTGTSDSTKRKKDNLPANRINEALKTFAAYDAETWDQVIENPIPCLGPGYSNNIEELTNIKNYVPGSSTKLSVALYNSEWGALASNPPALCLLKYMPNMGASSNDNNDPINQVAEILYRYISNVQRGGAIVTKYNRLDVILYLYACASVMTLVRFVEFIVRLGCTQLTPSNTIPLTYFAAIKLTDVAGQEGAMNAYDDIANRKSHWADRCLKINNKLKTLIIPDGLPIIEQDTNMIQALFADSENLDVAQLYAFAPIGVWKYIERVRHKDEDTGEWVYDAGASLEFHRFHTMATNGYVTLDMYFDKIEELLYALTTNSDVCYQIGQDIQTAYGTDEFWSPSMYIPSDIVEAQDFNPKVYDPKVLISIHNAVIERDITFWTYKIDIDAADPTKAIKLWGRPQFPMSTNYALQNNVPNLPLQFHAKPTKDEVAAALLFHPIASYIQVGDSDSTHEYVDFGSAFSTAIITEAVLTWKNPLASGNTNSSYYTWTLTERRAYTTQVAYLLDNWRDAPMQLVVQTISNGVVKIENYSGDREYELNVKYDQAKKYFEGMTRFNWGAEKNANSKGLYVASQRKTIG